MLNTDIIIACHVIHRVSVLQWEFPVQRTRYLKPHIQLHFKRNLQHLESIKNEEAIFLYFKISNSTVQHGDSRIVRDLENTTVS